MTSKNETSAPPVVENPAIPSGTREVLWTIAAAWADTTVEELLDDTAPVRAAHYEAAERVEKALDAWDLAQGYEGTPEPAKCETVSVEKHLSLAAEAILTVAPRNRQPESSSRYAALAADIYRVMGQLRSLPKVQVAK